MTVREALCRWRGATTIAAVVATALTVSACGSSSGSSTTSSGSGSSGSGGGSAQALKSGSTAAPTSYVDYTGGKAQAANPKLAPVEIGFVNDQGGSTVIAGTDPTTGAQAGVDWLNKYADGIDGHPVKLVTCFVKNAEAEGLTCAQEFLANPKIDVIAYGAMALGASTIDATVNGRKPIVEGVAINPPDLKVKNNFVLFGAVPFIDYPIGTFSKNNLHAKTAAVMYPNQTGQLVVEEAVQQAMEAEGIKTKLVGFDPNSTDLTSALEAAGATTADVVQTNVATPSECLAFARSAQQLGINPHKIIGLFQCQIPSIKSQYPGADYPKWNYSVADAGVEYQNNAAGETFRGVFKSAGLTPGDPWSLTEFSAMLTIAKLMNKISYASLSPATFIAQAKQFHGPELLGPSVLDCGKYPSAPAVCADGDAFFRYDGEGAYTMEAPWVLTPPALSAKLGAK